MELVLALSPQVSGISGRYFDGNQNIVEPSPFARDPNAQERLWQNSLELVGMGQKPRS